MASHSGAPETVRNPGVYMIPTGLRNLLIAFAGVGIACFAGGLAVDSKRAWFSFLHNHFYFMSLGLGGAFFAVLQWLTGAMWSAPIRRVAESLTAYIPVALVTFLILYVGVLIQGDHSIYLWTNPAVVHGDVVLEGKSGYLNLTFFMIRNVVALLLLIFFTRKMVGNSLLQDTTRDNRQTLRNRALSPAFLMVFAIGFTMASFDQLMSLDPHWFSTMFGVYCFAGLFYSVLALICIISILLKRNGSLAGIVTEHHIHDLGKFMFAFTVFWAYIGFSQFMLIWYANLPEETSYFMNRMSGGWMGVSIFLLVGKFMVPFFLLLPRDAKRNERLLLGVGSFMLFAQWVDMLWLTQPQLNKAGPEISWIEIGTALGFVGVFGLVVARFLSRNTIVAIGDPRLAESVFHHHQ